MGKNLSLRGSWFSNTATPLFEHLLTRKYRGYEVYAHNLSRFDIVFLFKDLAKLNKEGYHIRVMKRDDKFISIKITDYQGNIDITIKDSYLLLPSSLKKLSEQFNTFTSKGIEPVYTGNSKSPYYMADTSHYNKEIEFIQDLDEWKKKIEEYCEADCRSLYEVLINFRDLVYDKWMINIDSYPTTPSLAFAIFRTLYLKKDTIPLTHGKVAQFLRESYTGGSTEMYKPSPPVGEKVYAYDVNSLYPSVMLENPYPVGQIRSFEGNITILGDNYYWIGSVNVETKKDLYQPYLQIHYENRTVAPNGHWTMKINSPEYFNALKDYNFNIIDGYFFEKAQIFEAFVSDLFNLRQSFPKTDPMNYICKIMMNSLALREW